MNTFDVAFFLEGHDEMHIHRGTAIEWRGGLWFVLNWLQDNTTGEQIPERLLRIDSLRVQKRQDGSFLLPTAIPIILFTSRHQPETPGHYEIADYPVLVHTQEPKSTH